MQVVFFVFSTELGSGRDRSSKYSSIFLSIAHSTEKEWSVSGGEDVVDMTSGVFATY